MSSSLSNMGTLGLLQYNERQLEWATELGFLLVAQQLKDSDEQKSRRSPELRTLSRWYQAAGLDSTLEQLLEGLEDDMTNIYDIILLKVRRSHGSSICAIVIFGYLVANL